MAAARTITAANAVYMLTIPGLYSAPVQIQGFGTDEAFTTEAIEPFEGMMGVDGRYSAGFVPRETMQNITLQSDSLSIDVIERWYQTEVSNREKLPANGSITIASIGKRFTLTRGFLSQWVSIPSTRKVLQPRPFRITWETVSAALI